MQTTIGFLPGEPNEPREDEAHFYADEDEDYCSGDYRCRCPACVWVARRDAREDGCRVRG